MLVHKLPLVAPFHDVAARCCWQWACYHGAAVEIHGAERVNISDNSFRRLDNNAIILSNYTRHVMIGHNLASWLGMNFVVSWGDTAGFDGTSGTQPRYTTVKQNLVREIGNYEKQSSLYFSAKSCHDSILKNVGFNGPRAFINLNDGFGGNTTIAENNIWNTCRESGDVSTAGALFIVRLLPLARMISFLCL